YLPPSEERLAWLTGFSGSAGVALVLRDRAVLFVDGRYLLQAREQVEASTFVIEHLIERPPETWIEENLAAGTKLGYDPWLHTIAGAERLAKAAEAAGAKLVPVDSNPVDAVWSDRPAPPQEPVVLHDLRFAGEEASAKLARVAAEVGKARADALVVSDPHAVAWAFNIRGGDIAHTPVPLAFALVPKDGRWTLYVDGRKLPNPVRDALERFADVREPSALEPDLCALGAAGRSVRLDQVIAADALARGVTGAGGKVSRGTDPLAMMKAIKNAV